MGNQPTGSPPLPWFANPHARSWACRPAEQVHSGEVRGFHAGLPGYAPTPLTEVPALAAELGAGRVFVKDESARLGLPAFKVLGASWAVRPSPALRESDRCHIDHERIAGGGAWRAAGSGVLGVLSRVGYLARRPLICHW